MEELKHVVTQPFMDQDSALVLNAGVHLLKSTSFKNYQKIIKGFIKLLKENYRGRVVWKTTPSLGEQTQLYTGCSRRFHTEQVNRRATEVICTSQVKTSVSFCYEFYQTSRILSIPGVGLLKLCVTLLIAQLARTKSRQKSLN